MTRHARDPRASDPAEDTPASGRSQRAHARAEKAQQRRLAEREHVSGQIRTPAEITARRANRADKPRKHAQPPSKKTPVSARRLVPERTFSGRMILLTVVTLVVISFLVPTVRSYLQQQSEMDQLAEQIAEQEQLNRELYSELARWDDPQFVQQQARERINLVLPGERRYHVIGDLSEAEVQTDAAEDQQTEADWAEELWDSVVESSEQ